MVEHQALQAIARAWVEIVEVADYRQGVLAGCGHQGLLLLWVQRGVAGLVAHAPLAHQDQAVAGIGGERGHRATGALRHRAEACAIIPAEQQVASLAGQP